MKAYNASVHVYEDLGAREPNHKLVNATVVRTDELAAWLRDFKGTVNQAVQALERAHPGREVR